MDRRQKFRVLSMKRALFVDKRDSVGLGRHGIFQAVSRKALHLKNHGEFQVTLTQGLVIPGRNGQSSPQRVPIEIK